MIDLARVRQKAADIRSAIDSLQSLAQRPEAAFITDDLVVSAAKYKLIVATEAALDLCNHICAKRLRQAPDSYAHCMQLLARGGIISEETARKVIPMARFRNLLVHQYGQIDDRQLLQIIRINLGDLEQYLNEVADYLGHEL